ncbi:MAG: peptide chain release factor N(5)-glutamine methyltransferase [Lachnospiraceae bacterium]
MGSELGALYEEGRAFLKGFPDGDLDAKILLLETAGASDADLLADPHRAVGSAEASRYRAMLQKRKEHVPTAYLIGHAGFMGLDFLVTPDVLIPEQDTETLVEAALSFVKASRQKTLRVLDLCTGSGCILLSVLYYLRQAGILATGIGTDLSGAALAVAEKNRARLGLCKEAALVKGDLFAALADREREAPFDLILSNPPYIREDVIGTLAPEVRAAEPHMALSGRADGLVFYRRIAAGLGPFCRDGAAVFLEIGFDQGADVSRILKEAGFSGVRVLKDLGGNDRVVACEKAPK